MIVKRLTFACLIFLSCSGTEKARERRFQDIKGFFAEEVSRLENQKIKVKKTVTRNGVAESKENTYPNWATELSLFSESDINKPAWIDSYKVVSNISGTSYTAQDDKLRTRLIQIKKNKMGKIISVNVKNSTKNYLYYSSEELLYIPDSIYRILKKQDVILFGSNSYNISGEF